MKAVTAVTVLLLQHFTMTQLHYHHLMHLVGHIPLGL